MAYTKLFSSIVHSTIWREPNHTRLVWITMLAIADKHGIVEASIPGLADVSRVTLPECEEALRTLLSPDPYSRDKDNKGVRISEVRGGWEILNHHKYRELLSDEQRREREAERKARYRAENKNKSQCPENVPLLSHGVPCLSHDVPSPSSPPTPPSSPSSPDATTSPDPSPDPEKELKPARARVVYGQEFLSFWAAYPKKIGKDAAWKGWKKTKPPIEEVLFAISAQIETPAWKKDGGQFIPNPATWLNQGRWQDEIPAEEKITPQEANAKQLRAAFGKDYNPQ